MQVLQYQDPGANYFSGTMSSEIGNMRRVLYLSLPNNSLARRFLTKIPSIKGIKTFNLNMND